MSCFIIVTPRVRFALVECVGSRFTFPIKSIHCKANTPTTSKLTDNNNKTMNELKGHGDPLLVAAMKNLAIRDRQQVVQQKRAACCDTAGQGDPLLAAVQKHSLTLKRTASLPSMPHTVHSEFAGHGDPLMAKVLDSWEVVNLSVGKENLRPSTIVHGERKMHGDPLFREWLKSQGLPSQHIPHASTVERSSSLPLSSGRHSAEFSGHGDPLLDSFLDLWKLGETPKTEENLHPAKHGEFKKHGDLLFKEFISTI